MSTTAVVPAGAPQSDWIKAAQLFPGDILPSVCDNTAYTSISDKLAHLDSLAKTPSRLVSESDGVGVRAVGIKGWPHYFSTTQEVIQWAGHPAHGILLNTRNVRAIDIDIDEPTMANTVHVFLAQVLGIQNTAWVRYRDNSAKRTLLVRVSGAEYMTKRVIRMASDPTQKIEFLANGQQTALRGTHPSGARFKFSIGTSRDEGKDDVFLEAGAIPTVTLAQITAAWDMIRAALGLRDSDGEPADPSFAQNQLTPPSQSIGAEQLPENAEHDAVLRLVADKGMIRQIDRDAIYVQCPNKAQHTSDSGPTEARLYLPGVGGKSTYGFKCLHAHCEHINFDIFSSLIGYNQGRTAVLAALPVRETPLSAPPVAQPAFDAPRSLPAIVQRSEVVARGLHEIPKRDDLVKLWERQQDSKKGVTVCSPFLLQSIFSKDEEWVTVRRDEFTTDAQIRRSWAKDPQEWRKVDDFLYQDLRGALDERWGVVYPGTQEVASAISHAATLFRERNNDVPYDSALEWLDSLQWDGVPRIKDFGTKYLVAADTEYTRAVCLYSWTTMAARIMSPGVKADGMPILISPSQGTGKSSMVKAMAPDFAGRDGGESNVYAELALDASDDNLARLIKGKLVVEIPELKGLSSKDSESIKAWLSKAREEWIPKYMEHSITYGRRCFFWGTDNEARRLNDPTGARRFFPLDVAVGLHEGQWLPSDELLANDGYIRDQLWAEARELVRQYADPAMAVRDAYNKANALAGEARANATKIDAWAPTVVAYVRAPQFNADNVSATAVYLATVGVTAGLRGYGSLERARIESCLRTAGFVQDKYEPDKWRNPLPKHNGPPGFAL